MANHFHLLCEVPEPRPLSESEVLERIEAGYGPQRVQALQRTIGRAALSSPMESSRATACWNLIASA